MKRKGLWTLLLALLMALSLAPSAMAEGVPLLYTVEVEGTFDQSGARRMLDMVNDLRTGEDAWVLDENEQRVDLPGLGELSYSYDLEEIAMQRAIEVALSFSHTRPNGESCYTCIATDGERSWGENIAAGYTTPEKAFEGWCETDEPYSGQGHRRNMLQSGFRSIGIAHVVYGDTHYWVQEFSWNKIKDHVGPASDGPRICTVEVSENMVTNYGEPVIEPESMTLASGETAAAPRAGASLRISGAWYGRAPVAWITPDWQSADESIVKVEAGRVTALATGETSLSATAFGGRELSVAVVVTGDGDMDLNGDGVLDREDLVLLRQYLVGRETDLDPDRADLNGDGLADILDLVRLRKKLGS